MFVSGNRRKNRGLPGQNSGGMVMWDSIWGFLKDKLSWKTAELPNRGT